jgi:hypothetical protein
MLPGRGRILALDDTFLPHPAFGGSPVTGIGRFMTLNATNLCTSRRP